jgi:pimeloyl-ACP methyl ester carboxylesterase
VQIQDEPHGGGLVGTLGILPETAGGDASYVARRAGRSDCEAVAEDAPVHDWGTSDHDALQRLAGIRCPELILHGETDLVIPARASHLTAGLIPDARITIYPDSAHAFLFQYPGEAAARISTFLS